MYYNCELLIGGLVYHVAEYIKNWDEIESSFKRNDYDGVVRSFSNSFEFVKGARKLLVDEYKKNYLKSSASIVIYTRNNSWAWTERFRCALNFSTLKDDGFTLSINAVDDSVAALIKAKKGTQYEYVVGEVCEQEILSYDRMVMNSDIRWSDGGSLSEDGKESFIYFGSSNSTSLVATIPFYIQSSELSVKNIVEVNDASYSGFVIDNQRTPFIEAIEEQNIHLSIDFKVYGTDDLGGDVYTPYSEILLYLRDSSLEDGGKIIKKWPVYAKTSNYYPTHIEFDENIVLKKGTSLELLLNSVTSGGNLVIYESNGISVKFYAKDKPIDMNVIKPETILNRLLKSMNGGVDGLKGVIVPSGEKRLDNCMILAAESCKKYPNAKIYTSFTKFANWMSYVFGYVYDINGKVITFRPRKDYFSDNVVKVISDYSGYNMSVNASLIYSQLNIGYEKQDYESVNGRDEFRFTNIYNTGNTITDNKMEMISPYRADAYGIEFLAQKVGEDTTDNSSDNTVFFVCANLVDGQYILDRTESIEGVISPSTMFNVMYSPSSMIEANKGYLGGFMTDLSFASSEGNTDISINGNKENRNVSIQGGLFSVGEAEIETSDIELPEDMTGLVEFEHQGEIVQGYYKSADFSYSRTKSAKITLILKK